MKITTLSLGLLIISFPLFAQKLDTLHAGKPLKDFDKLNYEQFDFEVYSERDGKRSKSILMTSTTSKEQINGHECVMISHVWSSPNFNGNFRAIVESETFKPIIQIRNANKGKEAYRFSDSQVAGLDTALNNTAADYSLDLPFPVFNFEIDIETFSILPLAANKEFMIPFFHAGSAQSPPAYYKLIVEKSDKIDIPGQGKVACWVLYMDYHGKQVSRFWYTKKDRKFVKMEGEYGPVKIYKLRKF